MAHGFINVTRSNPCPICGKPDWCGWMPSSEQEDVRCLVCQRDTEKDDQTGFDGIQYKYVGESGGGNSVYMNFDDYYKQEKRRAGQKGQRPRNKGQAANVPKSAPKSLQPVNIIEPKSPEDLDLIYNFLVSKLKLKDEHRKYLHSQGWTDEMIEHYHVVSFPEADNLRSKNKRRDVNEERAVLAGRIARRFGERALYGVPGAYKDAGEWTFFGPSGILFPMYDLEGNLYRLRIRMDFRDQKDKIYKSVTGLDDYVMRNNIRHYICMKGVYYMEAREKVWTETRGKYRTLSSYIEDDEERKKGFLKNKLDGGCRSGNVISCYRPDVWDPSMLVITEGEPKGAYTAMKLGMEVWTLPGVNSYALVLEEDKIDYLKKRNICVLVAFDADKATNDNVLKMEQDLIKGLTEQDVPVMKLEWDIEAGKGIDDNLAAGGSLRFVQI